MYSKLGQTRGARRRGAILAKDVRWCQPFQTDAYKFFAGCLSRSVLPGLSLMAVCSSLIPGWTALYPLGSPRFWHGFPPWVLSASSDGSDSAPHAFSGVDSGAPSPFGLGHSEDLRASLLSVRESLILMCVRVCQVTLA